MATKGADDYEAKYMSDGEVIAREKKRMPWWYHLIFLMPCALVLGVAVSVMSKIGIGGLAALVPLPLVAFIWIAFAQVRVTVTRDAVQIHMGWFGPKIALRDIEAVGIDDSLALKLSLGQKYLGNGTWAYGAGGRGVFIEYRDAKGKKKKVIVSSDTPEALAATIERARAASAPARVRADVDDAEARLLAEAEAEAEAAARGEGAPRARS